MERCSATRWRKGGRVRIEAGLHRLEQGAALAQDGVDVELGPAGGGAPFLPPPSALTPPSWLTTALLIAGLVLVAAALPVGVMFALHLRDDARVERTFEQLVERQSTTTQSLWAVVTSQLEIIRSLARQPIALTAVQGGLPMPEKPEADWARCQNECGRLNQPFCVVDGQAARGVTGIRGVCWKKTINDPVKVTRPKALDPGAH